MTTVGSLSAFTACSMSEREGLNSWRKSFEAEEPLQCDWVIRIKKGKMVAVLKKDGSLSISSASRGKNVIQSTSADIEDLASAVRRFLRAANYDVAAKSNV